MKHVHYDLDKVERQIRQMFTMARAKPEPDDESRIFVHWQNRTEDLMVAFVRWGMQMEMEGVDHDTQAHIIGVQCAEFVANFANGWSHDPIALMEAIRLVMNGFTDHLNQNIQNTLSGGKGDFCAQFEPAESGNA